MFIHLFFPIVPTLILSTENYPCTSEQLSMLLICFCLFCFPTTTSGKALQKHFSVDIFLLLTTYYTESQGAQDDLGLKQSFFAALSLMCKTAVFALRSLCPRMETGMLFSGYIDLRTKACCKMRRS